MEFFEGIARSVNQRWKQAHYDPLRLPDIAVDVLKASPPSEHVSTEDVCRWVIESEALPKQPNLNLNFGQPPLTVYADDRLFIEILFWLDNTTAIHEHAFAGAFHVFEGSSVHGAYRFDQKERINGNLLLGDVDHVGVDWLTKGDVLPIRCGDEYIHALFHLDRPSATVVVRTYGLDEFRPQYRYLRPHAALNQDGVKAQVQRTTELLQMLRRTKHPAFEDLLMDAVRDADYESAFRVLWKLAEGGLLKPEVRDNAVALVRDTHGALADYLGPVLEQEARFARKRSRSSNADQRFFLALLQNDPGRDEALRLIGEKYPGVPTMHLVLSWLQAANQNSNDPIEMSEVQSLFGPVGQN